MKNIFRKLIISVGVLAFLAVPVISYAQLSTTLRVGSRSSEVTTLQTFLAQDVRIYPQGLVTGYFGSMTKAAVMKFQSQNGLKADGIVGPNTRAALNTAMAGGMGGAPMISNTFVSPSSTSATVNWNTDGLARGTVYYSTNPLTLYERENSVDVSGSTAMTDTNLRNSQSVALQGLQPGTTYYYLVYSTGQNGAVSVTWPSTFRTN